jgi:hypothetical protein
MKTIALCFSQRPLESRKVEIPEAYLTRPVPKDLSQDLVEAFISSMNIPASWSEIVITTSAGKNNRRAE